MLAYNFLLVSTENNRTSRLFSFPFPLVALSDELDSHRIPDNSFDWNELILGNTLTSSSSAFTRVKV